MDLPFLGMIAAFGFNFAPRNWAQCSGQLIPIAQNTALFSLLGTMYGGNGQNTFSLPDLRGRAPIGVGQGPGLSPYVQGQIGGVETVTILANNLPAHIHTAQGITSIPQGAIVAGDATTPENNYLALSPKIGSGPNATTLKTYATPAAATAVAGNIKPMVGNSVAGNTGVAGANNPFGVLQPYLVINYSIAMSGIFPSRN